MFTTLAFSSSGLKKFIWNFNSDDQNPAIDQGSGRLESSTGFPIAKKTFTCPRKVGYLWHSRNNAIVIMKRISQCSVTKGLFYCNRIHVLYFHALNANRKIKWCTDVRAIISFYDYFLISWKAPDKDFKFSSIIVYTPWSLPSWP